MTINKVPLNGDIHKSLKFEASKSYLVLEKEYLIPLTIHELPIASLAYPVLFVKNQQIGKFTLVAMMGVKPGENLFCQNKNWQGDYLPQVIIYAPFSLGISDKNKKNIFICVNEKSKQINIKDGEDLFDKDGKQTDFLRSVGESLTLQLRNMDFTEKIIATLLEYDLLVSQNLTLKFKDRDNLTISGLYIIDEEKLNKLPLEKFDKFRKQGALPAIYAQMNSMGQIARLIKLKEEKKQVL